MSDGAEFSIGLGVEGTGAVASAADALVSLSEKLELAGTAADNAAAAVKAGQTAYDQAETAANRAAMAVEKIGIQADAQRGKLQAALDAGDASSADRAAAKLDNLIARQSEAAQKAADTSAAMNAAAAALDNLKASAAAAADNESRLAGAVKEEAAAAKAAEAAAKAQAAAEAKVAKEADKAASAASKAASSTGDAGEAAGGSSINMRALSGALGKLGGPLGSVGQTAAGVGGALQKMSKTLGAAGPYVAAAVLAVALATAFVAATLAITKFAVESADAARTSALLSDGIAGSVKGGRALDDAIDRLGKTVPQSRDELLAMAGDLAKTGLKGEELSSALEEAAVKAAKLKWGPDFAKQMLSLPNQAARLKSNISGIFSGLNIEGLLEGLSTLVALFDKNSASAEAIKTVFNSLFQPVVDGLTGLIPKAVSTFIQLEILAMKALIAIKPYRGVLEKIGLAFAILAAVCVAAVALIIAIFLAAVAVPVLLIAGFIWLGEEAAKLGVAIREGAGAGLEWLTGKFNAVVDFLKGLSLSEIGSMLIQGLIDGITGAGAGVLKAITGIAGSAIDAAKSALGIASPSKVFAEIGLHTAAGMEQGVDSGATGVQSSMENLVEPPAPAASSGGAPATATVAGGGNTYIIHLHPASDDAGSYVDAFREFLESLGAQAGTAVP